MANKIGCGLGMVMVAKIGELFREEFALGAVAEEGIEVWGRHVSMRERLLAYLNYRKAVDKVREGVEIYRNGQSIPNFEGESAILVDDGIATGLTMLAAIRLLTTKHPSELWVATPVGEKGVVETLEYQAKVVSLADLQDGYVGRSYRNFEQVETSEVIQLLSTGK